MIWLFDNVEMRIEGTIIVRVPIHLVHAWALNIGFDEGVVHFRNAYCLVKTSIICILSLFTGLLEDLCSCTLSVQGFDEFMNVVIDEAAEVFVKDAKPRRELGAPA